MDRVFILHMHMYIMYTCTSYQSTCTVVVYVQCHQRQTALQVLCTYLFHFLHAYTALIHVVLKFGRARTLKVILQLFHEFIIKLRQLLTRYNHCRHV